MPLLPALLPQAVQPADPRADAPQGERAGARPGPMRHLREGLQEGRDHAEPQVGEVDVVAVAAVVAITV